MSDGDEFARDVQVGFLLGLIVAAIWGLKELFT